MPNDFLIPAAYPRRVLLAVTGLSPQVVTDTLCHLCRLRQPAFVPTEIHLVTIAEGARHAELTLLHPSQGRFHRLLTDFDLAGQITFDSSQIHVLRDSAGLILEDIRSDADTAAAADAITALFSDFTANADCALHVSLAGGRKTLGYYFGYAHT